MACYLKQVRQERRLTQEELGRRVGLKKSAISLLESGHSIGRVTTWDRLEEALGVPAKQLRAIVREES
jgi:transcriptional regulator with XRE-family HTH domain